MMTSMTFILVITTAGRPSTELQVVQISVNQIQDIGRACESKHLPLNGKAAAVPGLHFKAESYWLPRCNSIVSVGYTESYTAVFIQQAISMLAFTVICSLLYASTPTFSSPDAST
jgi:hypothetical protein